MSDFSPRCAQERTCIQRHGGTKSNTRRRSVQPIIIERKAPKILKSLSGNLGNFRPEVGARFRDWVYVDTSKEVGDAEHLKVFADQDAAQAGGAH
jgi:hypothetical protein